MKQTMLIVGLGLIGGSLALALKGFEDFEIVGVDVSQPTLRYAAEHGVGDRVTEDAAAELPQADCIFRIKSVLHWMVFAAMIRHSRN